MFISAQLTLLAEFMERSEMTQGIFKHQNIFNLCKFNKTDVNSRFFAEETEVNMEFLLISIKSTITWDRRGLRLL